MPKLTLALLAMALVCGCKKEVGSSNGESDHDGGDTGDDGSSKGSDGNGQTPDGENNGDCDDADGDDYGDGADCAGPDCDDKDIDVHPGALETCNGIDDDCSGIVDDGLPMDIPCDGADTDSCEEGLLACEDGKPACDDDVDDDVEECDGLDNDCDGDIPTDEVDVDDDGVLVCAGDCDDTDAEVYLGATEICDGKDNDCEGSTDEDSLGRALSQPCYTAAPSTNGVGVCREGAQTCVDGGYSTCLGEVTPTAESCNALDDDCNASVDDGLGSVSCGLGACFDTDPACDSGNPNICTPLLGSGSETCGNGIDDNCNGAIDDGCVCVYVSPAGNDANSGLLGNLAKRTITAGIAAAVANGLSQVCVAAGTSCPATGTYSENVEMVDGISVFGGYDDNGPSPWSRPSNCVTEIENQDDDGVSFPDTVTSPTVLDRFNIQSDGLAAVTVVGSTGAILTNNFVYGSDEETSYGVHVTSGATPIISRCYIEGGTGGTLSIGVYSVDSSPLIMDNCDTISGGACTSACANRGSFFALRRSIVGHPDTCCPSPVYTGDSFAVVLDNSPGAELARNAMCGVWGDQVAGVRVTGDATGTMIHGSGVSGWGGSVYSHGIVVEPCAGAAPRVFDNNFIGGEASISGTLGDGIHSMGDCHPVIDSNEWIVGGMEAASSDVNGVHCGAFGGTASQCVVADNEEIRGTGGGAPPTSTGVRCSDGACARIQGNLMIEGVAGVSVVGVLLEETGALVDDNLIAGGCPTTSGEAIGLDAIDSAARLENNLIFAGHCASSSAPIASYFGLRAQLGALSNELDVHSNNLFGDGNPVACTGRAAAMDTTTSTSATLGIFRNNILHAGNCTTRYAFAELSVDADPRVFEHNDLWASTTLYRDEASTNIDPTGTAGNISANPAWSGGYHLYVSSPCRNAGTSTGAPVVDFDGNARPQESLYDIGADEYLP